MMTDKEIYDAYMKRVTPRNWNVYGIDEACIGAGYSMLPTVETRGVATAYDYMRGQKLGHTPIGNGEDKLLRFIHVDFDWELPRYMWQEVDTYHFLERNSQSTMHRILEMDIEKACSPYTTAHVTDMTRFRIKCYKQAETSEQREIAWLELKANIPEGLMLVSRITTNYATLKTIYRQRKYHKNPEWRVFCKWIEDLPMVKKFGVCGKEDLR